MLAKGSDVELKKIATEEIAQGQNSKAASPNWGLMVENR